MTGAAEWRGRDRAAGEGETLGEEEWRRRQRARSETPDDADEFEPDAPVEGDGDDNGEEWKQDRDG